MQSSSNYLINGGFELTLPNNVWTQSGSISFGMGYNSQLAKSLSIDSSNHTSFISQNVSLKDGEYYLSFYINSKSASNGNVNVRVVAVKSGEIVTEQSVPVNEKSE